MLGLRWGHCTEKTTVPLMSSLHWRMCIVPRSPRVQPILYSLLSEHNTIRSFSLNLAHCIEQRPRTARRCVPQSRHPHSNFSDEAQERLERFYAAFGTGNSGYRSGSATDLNGHEVDRILNGYRATLHSTSRCILQ